MPNAGSGEFAGQRKQPKKQQTLHPTFPACSTRSSRGPARRLRSRSRAALTSQTTRDGSTVTSIFNSRPFPITTTTATCPADTTTTTPPPPPSLGFNYNQGVYAISRRITKHIVRFFPHPHMGALPLARSTSPAKPTLPTSQAPKGTVVEYPEGSVHHNVRGGGGGIVFARFDRVGALPLARSTSPANPAAATRTPRRKGT